MFAQLPCIENALKESPCSATNQTCMCTDLDFTTSAGNCILSTCSFADGLATKNITETECGYVPGKRDNSWLVVTTIFSGICLFFFIQRFVLKLWVGLPWTVDDIFGIFSMGIIICNVATRFIHVYGNGFGQDSWVVPVDQIIDFLKWLFVDTVLYMALTTFVKEMFLFFFLQIFPGKISRRYIWGTIIFTACYGISSFFATLFQCKPISYFWTQYQDPTTGKCGFDQKGLLFAQAGFGIGLDFWIIGIPLFHVFKLNIDTPKKLAIVVMFLLAFL